MKKLTLIMLFIGLAVNAAMAQTDVSTIQLNGQPQCLFNEVLNKTDIGYLDLVNVYRTSGVMQDAQAKTTAPVYDLPVVFHIVYGASQSQFNLADSVIINQLNILNDAFRKRHADTGKTRSVFKPLSVDGQIQFHLATVDPNGAPTTGITRTVSNRAFFGSSAAPLDSLEHVKSTADGGIDPWPTDRYINVWICNMSDQSGQLSVLGYGIPPLNPVPNNWPVGTGGQLGMFKDGVVLQVHAVGSNNPQGAAVGQYYSRGRALVHEIGHYLGLQHVFGGGDGNNAVCGTVQQSDGMNDTPEQGLLSFTPGSAPSITKNSCGSGASDSLDMWENYMDYTVDSFQTMFTQDQITLMRGVLENQRVHLTFPTSVSSISQVQHIEVFPNPAATHINVRFGKGVKTVSLLNLQGMVVAKTANVDNGESRLDVANLPSGLYILLLEDGQGGRITRKVSVVK